MTRRGKTTRKGSRGIFVPLRSSVAAWLAALAFILQIGLGAAPLASGASPAERAAAALSAAVGQQVSLCAEGGHSGAPDQSCPFCGDCALCGIARHVAPLAPARIAGPLAPERRLASAFVPHHEIAAAAPVFVFGARPRAPPVPV